MVSSANAHAAAGRLPLVVGNWKMDGTRVSCVELLAGLRAAGPFDAEVSVCCPFPYLADVALSLQGSGIGWGAQDCSQHEPGAYTGEVAAVMLAEFGCRHVIVGHSERRIHHAESDTLVADKARLALSHGLTPIVCVGETRGERDAGSTELVVKRQLSAVIHTLGHCVSQIVVAYEPIWAIGTGSTPSSAQIAEMHGTIRAALRAKGCGQGLLILYGGSVRASNCVNLLTNPGVDGLLVGAASLDTAAFLSIISAAA